MAHASCRGRFQSMGTIKMNSSLLQVGRWTLNLQSNLIHHARYHLTSLQRGESPASLSGSGIPALSIFSCPAKPGRTVFLLSMLFFQHFLFEFHHTALYCLVLARMCVYLFKRAVSCMILKELITSSEFSNVFFFSDLIPSNKSKQI